MELRNSKLNLRSKLKNRFDHCVAPRGEEIDLPGAARHAEVVETIGSAS
jgi:hypothetical protein